MKKNIRIALCILIILFFAYICYMIMHKEIKRENISKIEIDFNDFNGIYTFYEKENINIALDKEKLLRTYISPNGTFGVYQTIEYKVFYNNGKIIKKKYNNVYPVDKIFKPLFNSEEYKKQAIFLFKDEAFEVDKLTLYIEPMRTKYIEITDKELIKGLIIALREYYLTTDELLEEYDINHINTIETEFSKNSYVYACYAITPNNTEGLELLKKVGIYNDLVVNANNIENMAIFNGDVRVDIYDKELIQIIIDSAGREGRGTTVMHFVAKTKDNFEITGNFYKNQVPEKIEALFKY